MAEEVGCNRQVDRCGTPWNPKSLKGVSNSKSRAMFPTEQKLEKKIQKTLTFVHKVFEGHFELVALFTLLLLGIEIISITHISSLAQIGRNFTNLEFDKYKSHIQRVT